jgi:hypothetical protein
MLSIEIKGDREMQAMLDRASKAAQGEAIQDGLKACVFLIQDKAQQGMQKGAKTGRLYRRGRKWHQASAPGQPPAVDTGLLVGAFSVKQVDSRTVALRVHASYAADLEFGTVRMAARPILRPIPVQYKTEIEATWAAVVRARLMGAL